MCLIREKVMPCGGKETHLELLLRCADPQEKACAGKALDVITKYNEDGGLGNQGMSLKK